MDIASFVTKMEAHMELDEGVLQEGTPLRTLSAWDSFAVIGYIALVDQLFHRSVASKDITQAKTINDLYMLAQGKLIES